MLTDFWSTFTEFLKPKGRAKVNSFACTQKYPVSQQARFIGTTNLFMHKTYANCRRCASALALSILTAALWAATPATALAQNNSIGTAQPLAIIQDPADLGNFIGRITNSVGSGAEVDYWSFDALAGDVVSLA